MKKVFLYLGILVGISSCGVQTMTKIAGKMTEVGVNAVGAVLKGIDSVYGKAQGKINIHRLNGVWELKEVYEGSYEYLRNQKGLEDKYKEYNNDIYTYEFNTPESLIVVRHYDIEREANLLRYEYSFEKAEETGKYENIIRYGYEGEYFYVINVKNDKLIIERDITLKDTVGKAVLVFEKKK